MAPPLPGKTRLDLVVGGIDFGSQLLAGVVGPSAVSRDKMSAVLVVEDEHLTALALCDALARAGFRVETAHSAEDAYAKLAPEPRSFTAIVTDVNLGSGADGFAVADQARALNPAIQVAYMTGNPKNLARFEPERALMFAKPVDPEEVADQLSLLAPAA